MAEGAGSSGSATELDRVVAALEALRPEEFVAARDELAKRLRAQGDRATADIVARLRRPTLSVWAANEVARERPELTERLLALGEELEAAQRAVTAGKASAARELQRLLVTERRELDGVVEAGRTLLIDAGYQASVPVLERLRASLHAAAVTPAGREALAGGRLTQDLQMSGLEVGAELPTPQPRAARPAPARPREAAPPAPSERAEPAVARQAAEETLAAARAEEDRAAAHAQRTQQHSEEAAEMARTAEAQARMLRETADQLAQAAAELTSRAEAAERAADEAARQAEASREAASHAAEQAQMAAGELDRAQQAHRQAAERAEQTSDTRPTR